MQILPINYQIKSFLYNKNKTNNQNQNINNVSIPYQLAFEGRVDKGMIRFEPYHDELHRLPDELKDYLSTVQDKISLKPPKAMKDAYAKLMTAESVEDVKRLFPKEKLFKHLTTLENTTANIGIIKIYKEFQELFENGILKSGDDFTVYLLRKIFVETKVYKEINEDLDDDLLPDIKDYFRNKYNHNTYIRTEILHALGIYPPDQHMRNSLKFTKDGYSDKFGLIISMALLRRLKDMTDEEKEAEIDIRREGLENWWNDMSPEERMELATSVDVQEEGYSRYKKFDNENRRLNRTLINSLPEFQETEKTKRAKKSLKLNDKEVYILWMQQNLAKFYNSMTDTEKIAFELERSAKQAKKWQEMTPEQRIEFIQSIKEGIEPLRFAMIDAWNHSLTLIRTLKEFLKEQQIFKPVELVYDSDEFIKLQSTIMTEFWNQNRDLAERFGTAMQASHRRVKEAIENGTFEKLKSDILLEKDKRVKKLQAEYQAEAEEIKKAEEAKIQEKEAAIPKEDTEYRKEFAEVYIKSIDKHGILPPLYAKEMAEIFLDRFPKDLVIRYTASLKNKEPIPKDVMEYIEKEQEKNDAPRVERLQRALETAIAEELTSKGATHSLFQMDIDTLIPLLNHRYEDRNVPKSKRIDKYNIARKFGDYVRDLSDEELNAIASSYFTLKRDVTEEENEMCANYLASYGRSLLKLFSYKSAYSDSVKFSFNEKFLRLMPRQIKEFIHPFIQTPEDIFEENEINSLVKQIYNRFKYLPDDILKLYTREIATTIRLDRETHEDGYLNRFKTSFFSPPAIEKAQSFPTFEKRLMSKDEIFKILAVEQAMADEFYEVTQNDDAYSKYFEQLLNFYDTTSTMKNNKAMSLSNKDGVTMFTVSRKPDKDAVYKKYTDYLNAIKTNKEIINPDGTINKEKLLFCLNSKGGRPEKLLGTRKRIDLYFSPEPKEEIQTPAEEIKQNTETQPNSEQLKKDFRIEFARNINSNRILPTNYVKELGEIILETFPKETIEEYILNPSAKNMFTNEVLYKNCSGENLKRLKRIQHAIAAAIAEELAAKSGDYSLYGEPVDILISKLNEQEAGLGLKKQNKTDTDNIQERYNYYKRDLSKGDLVYIANNFFYTDHASTKEEDDLIMDYIDEYGRSAEILFSVDISLPLNAKEAFNNKFLNSMPEEVRNVATPFLKTREDLKQNYDIEIVRRQLAKRLGSVIPKEPLNIYTREVAKMMRLMNQPDADPVLKEKYGIEAYKKSLSQKDENGELVPVLKLPKYYINDNTNKLYLLALEQAMADELYRVSKNNIVYACELEDLAPAFELAPLMKKVDKKEWKLTDPDSNTTFIMKQIPNKNNIIQKYIKYLKEFQSDENIFLENGNLNREEILFCLNPDEKNKDKDEAIKGKIECYFED